MRVTVLNPDKAIGVEGEFYYAVNFQLRNDIHAIQWYGTWGEIEYAVKLVDGKPLKPENASITDFAPYEYLISAWQQAKEYFALEQARLAAERIAAQNAMLNETQTTEAQTPV